jgi:hypothetical protein
MKTTRSDFANGTVTEGWTQPKMSVKVGTDNASAALAEQLIHSRKIRRPG